MNKYGDYLAIIDLKDAEVDVTDAYDALTSDDQESFIADKFGELDERAQARVMDEMITYIPEYKLVEILEDAIDNLSDGQRDEIREYLQED